MIESQSPTWPRKLLTYRMLGLVLALACGFGLVKVWAHAASPLQRFYLWTYVRTTVLADLPRIHSRLHPWPSYKVIETGGKPLTERAYELNPNAPISLVRHDLRPSIFGSWLRRFIYQDRPLLRTLLWPLVGFGLCLIAFVWAGIHLDRERTEEAREGRLLRGPYLLSRWKFNRLTKGDGLRFRLTNKRNLPELFKAGSSGYDLIIRRDREAHHVQIAGDTGTGKSTLIRQVLYQIEQRSDGGIVFDPDREYIQEFFNESRGDWVLNPKDERCPYWPIGSECDDEATATPIAMGFFPDAPTRQQFFLTHTRAIFSFLLATYKPTVNELAYWMAHPEEIDERVKGTEHEHTLTVNAAPQRAGILGSLNEAGKQLRMMPTSAEDRRTWTVREWAKERKGWLFITSTADTIDALRPLQSLWLDMLILKLQSSETRPGQPRVWMVIDELASLNALPQLMTALTKQRKSDNPIVLGFQSMAQLADAYGDKKAETILSQAFTNIMLRTRESRAAKHGSEMIGKAQLERIRESRPTHSLRANKQGSYSSERLIDPVVMESELQGLDDLNGYLVQLDKVVAIQFEPFAKRKVAPGLIERAIPAFQGRELDPKSASLEKLRGSAGDAAPRSRRGNEKSRKTAAKTPLEEANRLSDMPASELQPVPECLEMEGFQS